VRVLSVENGMGKRYLICARMDVAGLRAALRSLTHRGPDGQHYCNQCGFREAFPFIVSGDPTQNLYSVKFYSFITVSVEFCAQPWGKLRFAG
jgi:hypothetical protein